MPQPGGDQPYLGDPKPDPNDAVYDADTLVADADGQLRLLGHVIVRYRGYKLTSERADIDPDRRTVLFSGNFAITSPQGQTVQGGQYGTLDLRQRGSIYRVTGARTAIPPQDLPLGIIQPLFIYGGPSPGGPASLTRAAASSPPATSPRPTTPSGPSRSTSFRGVTWSPSTSPTSATGTGCSPSRTCMSRWTGGWSGRR